MEYLPVEVLSHIFKFLPSLEDRKAASLVCRLWYEAFQSPIFRRDEYLEITSNESFDQLYELTNPHRVFFNVRARGVEINKDSNNFWDRFGPSIKTLSVISCDFREKAFMEVIKRCDQLESLCIQDCRELLMSGSLLENEEERNFLRERLSSLKSLDLGYNRYLSDTIFVRFGSICGGIEELSLPGCFISFHSGLYHKFYKTGHCKPSESVFTFPIIFDFIEEHASHLKMLSFTETLIDSDAVSCIAQTKDLALEKLHLRECVQVTNDCIITLSQFQVSLTHLDLALCPRITDLSLLTICSRLIKLKSLSIQGCRAITDMGISDLWRLTELNRLNISECPLIHDEGIIKGLCTRRNPNLEELYLSHLGNLSGNSVIQMMDFLPNLKVLDLGYCYHAVTDRSVQSIFSSAKRLTNLALAMCESLTDRGLTGIALDLNPPVSTEVEESRLRIPLGSRAELDIIKEARLKQDVRKICESIGLTSDLTGSSVSNLKQLQKLNLSKCISISDISLRYAFKLADLRWLDLSFCHQITVEGLAFICENCPSIEFLNLDQCHKVNDDGASLVIKKLKRLKSLVLGSKRITDHIADCICLEGTSLAYLDLRHCDKLSTVSVTEIMKCRPRLTLLHFASLASDFQYMAAHPPPPPPPPPPLPPVCIGRL